jgi:hypothetical protein
MTQCDSMKQSYVKQLSDAFENYETLKLGVELKMIMTRLMINFRYRYFG